MTGHEAMKASVQIKVTRTTGALFSRPDGARTTLRRPPRGFALRELLIVIAVLLFLLLLALNPPTFHGHRSRRAVCAANLHHVALGTQLYAVDNDGWTTRLRWKGDVEDPRFGWAAWAPPQGEQTPVAMGAGMLIGDYVTDGHILYCVKQTHPAYQYDNPDTGWAHFGDTRPKTIVRIGYFGRTSQQIKEEPVAVLGDMWYLDHSLTAHDAEGVNISFTDGSAIWFARGDPDHTWWMNRSNGLRGHIDQIWALLDAER